MPAPLATPSTAAQMTQDSPSDKAVTSLYRAALGPVNTEHYMPVFARLDAVGRTLTSWHWSACVFTLGWMVFRRLWGAALVYVAAAEGVALLVFGLGRPLLQWPQAVEWGVVGAFAVVSSVIPGLYAHAILHADIRKRVTNALAASANITQACDLLASQAVSRKRLHWVISGHALIAAAAVLAYVLFPQGLFDMPATQTTAVRQEAVTRAVSWDTPEPTMATASRPATTASATASPASAEPATPGQDASAPEAPVLQPPEGPSSSASTPAAAHTPAKLASPASGTTTQAVTPQSSASSQNALPAQSSEGLHPAPPLPMPASKSNAPSTAKASAPATSKPDASKPVGSSKSAEPVRAKPPATAKAPAGDAATVGSASGFYINVGLFADESNARKAQSRLLNEGLPAFRQTLDGAQGARVRVRVGPYGSRSEAEATAARVRRMGLEAVVFRK